MEDFKLINEKSNESDVLFTRTDYGVLIDDVDSFTTCEMTKTEAKQLGEWLIKASE